jgi:hypothetical protein
MISRKRFFFLLYSENSSQTFTVRTLWLRIKYSCNIFAIRVLFRHVLGPGHISRLQLGLHLRQSSSLGLQVIREKPIVQAWRVSYRERTQPTGGSFDREQSNTDHRTNKILQTPGDLVCLVQLKRGCCRRDLVVWRAATRQCHLGEHWVLDCVFPHPAVHAWHRRARQPQITVRVLSA